MTGPELAALAPLIILGGGATLVMLQIALRRGAGMTRVSTVLVLLAALAACIWCDGGGGRMVTPLLRADDLAVLFTAMFCAATAVCVLLSRDYLPGLSDQGDEYYLLMLLATLGGGVLAYASHVASLVLGLELMSVALYALVAYPARAARAAEAAAKYMVLSGGASATMLFGFALLYAMTGSMEFAALGTALPVADGGPLLLAAAAVLIVSGLCFKLSVAPFHLWTPDVYEGAPSPVTAFLATIAKAAPFVALLRLVFAAGLLDLAGVVEVLALLAVLSMLVGNLLALLQDNVKRILAYSSIAHMGYALLVFTVAAEPAHRALAGEAGAFYMLSYIPATLAAFGLLSLLNAGGDGEDRASIDELDGLFWRQPLLAVLLVVALLSLAGIPLTGGFIGKFYLFAAAVEGSHWGLLAALVTGSAIGIYYYLRMVYRMTLKPAADGRQIILDPGVVSMALLLIGAILVLGLLPQPLMVHLQGIF